MSTRAMRFPNVENGGNANVQSSIETRKRALQGEMAGNQLSTRAKRSLNVENGGKANVQSSIETTKVEHGIMEGNRLSMWALQGDTAGNQMSTQAMRCPNKGNSGNANVQSTIETRKLNTV